MEFSEASSSMLPATNGFDINGVSFAGLCLLCVPLFFPTVVEVDVLCRHRFPYRIFYLTFGWGWDSLSTSLERWILPIDPLNTVIWDLCTSRFFDVDSWSSSVRNQRRLFIGFPFLALDWRFRSSSSSFRSQIFVEQMISPSIFFWWRFMLVLALLSVDWLTQIIGCAVLSNAIPWSIGRIIDIPCQNHKRQLVHFLLGLFVSPLFLFF